MKHRRIDLKLGISRRKLNNSKRNKKHKSLPATPEEINQPVTSMLLRLAEDNEEIFMDLISKLKKREIRALHSTCRILRQKTKTAFLQWFVEKSVQLNSPEHFRNLYPELGIALTTPYFREPVFRTRIASPKVPIVGPTGTRIMMKSNYGYLVWDHFPCEQVINESIITFSRHLCYWLTPLWKKNRQHFLQQARSKDLETAVKISGRLTLRFEQDITIRTDRRNILCLPIHLWWIAEARTMDYFSMIFGGVFVHPESETYHSASQYVSETFLDESVLICINPSNPFIYEIMEVSERAAVHPSFPEIIADQLFWISTSRMAR